MPTEIIMPALGMAQETGLLVSWLKREGEKVAQGEPVMEIETDKATVEIEAPASGVLSQVSAHEGDNIPVGKVIAYILAEGETAATPAKDNKPPLSASPVSRELSASPVARKIAAEHGLDLAQVKSNGERITKEDVLAHLERSEGQGARSETRRVESAAAEKSGAESGDRQGPTGIPGRVLASPKARRLAVEMNIPLAEIHGSGPGGAVIAEDVMREKEFSERAISEQAIREERGAFASLSAAEPEDTSLTASVPAAWRVMAERMSASWTSAPHFYLMREVKAAALVEMRERITPLVEKRSGIKPSYTDLLVRLIGATLRDHPRMLASWAGDGLRMTDEINIGLAVGTEDSLIVPVIHRADTVSVGEIAKIRQDLVKRANERKLRPADLAGGTFTLTNLGMYNVDAFLAILNPPQAAILAVGRIADRVIPENGAPAVRPVMVLTLSCDHRVIDGLRAAQFLDDLTKLIEEPWGLLA